MSLICKPPDCFENVEILEPNCNTLSKITLDLSSDKNNFPERDAEMRAVQAPNREREFCWLNTLCSIKQEVECGVIDWGWLQVGESNKQKFKLVCIQKDLSSLLRLCINKIHHKCA